MSTMSLVDTSIPNAMLTTRAYDFNDERVIVLIRCECICPRHSLQPTLPHISLLLDASEDRLAMIARRHLRYSVRWITIKGVWNGKPTLDDYTDQ